MSVEVVHRTPKPIPEKVAKIWAEEWAKEGREIDWQRLIPRRGFEVLPRRWVVVGLGLPRLHGLFAFKPRHLL